MFKAIAAMRNGARVFDVVIYSSYKTIEEAVAGVASFTAHGYEIERVEIKQED